MSERNVAGNPMMCVGLLCVFLCWSCGKMVNIHPDADRDGRDGSGDSDTSADADLDADLPEADPDADADPEGDADLESDGDIDRDDPACMCIDEPGGDPVTFFHPCTPPLEIGCPAQVCEPGEDECGEGYSCVDCAGAACCICAACVPVCVFDEPSMGPLPEYLKLRDTQGPANREQQIRIAGYPFYIGAIFFVVRVGDAELHWSGPLDGSCTMEVTVPPQPAGTVPVWVSQYRGEEPWVLAGFFTFSPGVEPLCVQPGYPCGHSGYPDNCCQTTDVPMSCQGGRCRQVAGD